MCATTPKLTGCPSRSSSSMAWWAAARAASWRRVLARRRSVVQSALVVIWLGFIGHRLQGRDDLFQVRLHASQVFGQSVVAVGVGSRDQLQVVCRLPPVDLQELRRRLVVRAGQAGVRVRAVLLRRAAAVSVGKAVADPVEVVLDPFGAGGRSFCVVVDDAPRRRSPVGLGSGRTRHGWSRRARARNGRSCSGSRGRAFICTMCCGTL